MHVCALKTQAGRVGYAFAAPAVQPLLSRGHIHHVPHRDFGRHMQSSTNVGLRAVSRDPKHRREIIVYM